MDHRTNSPYIYTLITTVDILIFTIYTNTNTYTNIYIYIYNLIITVDISTFTLYTTEFVLVSAYITYI